MSSTNIDVHALCETHRATLRRFLDARMPRWLRHRESIADLEQTVWRQVLHAAPDLEYRGEPMLREWLLTMARNKLIDRVRFHRRECRDVRREQRMLDDGADALAEPRHVWSAPRVLAGREELERFDRGLARLARDEREAIQLCKLQGLSAAAAGFVLGRGEGATRALLSRALARLSTWLAMDEP